jgi:hypothetical protein
VIRGQGRQPKQVKRAVIIYGAPVLGLLRRSSNGKEILPIQLRCPAHGPSSNWVCCCVHVFEQKSDAKHKSENWILCGRCHGLTRAGRVKWVPDTKIRAVCRGCLKDIGVVTA